MRVSGQFQTLLFVTKRFHTHKKHKTHISEQKQKRQHFYALKKHLRARVSLIRLFAFLCFLCLQNPFVNKKVWNYPDNLIYISTSKGFRDTCTIETGFWDFPKLVVGKLFFPNKNPLFKLKETFKELKMIYLDRKLIISYQNLMYVTLSSSIF